MTEHLSMGARHVKLLDTILLRDRHLYLPVCIVRRENIKTRLELRLAKTVGLDITQIRPAELGAKDVHLVNIKTCKDNLLVSSAQKEDTYRITIKSIAIIAVVEGTRTRLERQVVKFVARVNIKIRTHKQVLQLATIAKQVNIKTRLASQPANHVGKSMVATRGQSLLLERRRKRVVICTVHHILRTTTCTKVTAGDVGMR